MKKFQAVLLSLALGFTGPALAATFNLFSPANGILKGTPTSYVTSAANATDVISLWSGTCNASTFLRADGSCQAATTTPAGADTQVQFNDGGVFGGSGNFTWNDVSLRVTTPAGLNPGVIVTGNAAGAPIVEWQDLSVAANGRRWWSLASGSWQLFAVDDAGTPGQIGLQIDRQSGTSNITRSWLIAGGTSSLSISAAGDFRVNGSAGTSGQVLTSGGAGAPTTWTTLAGVPGGADTQVQYNNAGAFGGDAGLTYNAGTDTLTVGVLTAGTGVLAPILTSPGSLSLTATGANDAQISTNGSLRLSIGSTGDWLVGGTVGTAGRVLTSNGTGVPPSWQVASAGAGGSNTQVQFNNGGALAGDSGLTYNSTTDVLTASGASFGDGQVGGTWQVDTLEANTNIVLGATNITGVTGVGSTLVMSGGPALTGDPTVNGVDICLLDGTNCPTRSAAWTTVIKSGSTTSRSSTTTLAADPDIQFTPAAGTYEMTFCFTYNGSTTGDQGIKFALNRTTAGSTFQFWQGAYQPNTIAGVFFASGGIGSPGSTSNQILITDILVSSSRSILCGTGMFVAQGSVTYALEWAQEASSANNTNLVGGGNTWIKYRLSSAQ